MMASASTAVALASCSAYGHPGVPSCNDLVTLDSPCGFLSETTTCAGTKTCKANMNDHTCTFGPMTASCTITVVLGDGTSHTVAVTVQPAPASCVSASVVVSSDPSQSFTCSSLQSPDAGVDAPDDAVVE